MRNLKSPALSRGFIIIAKQLYDERVQLFAACNMFKKFITPSLEVTNYMVKHTQEVNLTDFCSADEEVASDEDDDSDSDSDDILWNIHIARKIGTI